MRRVLSSKRHRLVSQSIRRVIRTSIERLEERRLLCLNTGEHLIHDDPQRWTPEQILQEQARIDELASRQLGTSMGGQADIVWVNRGVTAGANNDLFNDVFGANAALARNVMDAAIVMWERVLGNFNYSDGSTTLNVTIKMDDAGTSNGASANVTQYLNGKPKAGRITMGRGNDGAGGGWFLDPTPFDHSEFTNPTLNPFTGSAQPGSPAQLKGDFLSVALAELTHVVGLVANAAAPGNSLFEISPKIFDTVFSDSETLVFGETSKLWYFSGTQSSRLLTTRNGSQNFGVAIHTAGYGTNDDISVGGGRNYYERLGTESLYGQDDLGNFTYDSGTRYLVNESLRLLFDEIYGYSTLPAANFGSMYANLQSDGELFINLQGFNTSNPVTTIEVVGSNYVVTVDANLNENGVGAYQVGGQVAPWVHSFPTANVSRITYVGKSVSNSSSVSADTLIVRDLLSGDTLDVDLGSSGGNDTLRIGGDDINGNIIVEGGIGNDLVVYDDTPNTSGAISYSMIDNVLSRAGNGTVTLTNIEDLQVLATGGNNAMIFQNVPDTLEIILNGGNGNDTLTVGSDNCNADIAFVGGTGTDLLRYIDSAQVESAQHALLNGSFSRTNNGTLVFSTTEQFELLAGNGPNTINVNSSANLQSVTVNGGAGDDIITVGGGDLDTNLIGVVNLVGGNGNDTLAFNDTTDGVGSDVVNITQSSVDKTLLANPITFSEFELHRFNASSHNDSITISSGREWQINGNNGADTIDVLGIVTGDRVTINGGAGLDVVRSNTDGLGVAAVQFDVSQDLAQLNVGFGGSVFVTPGLGNLLIDTASLFFGASSSRLDLGNNRLIVRQPGTLNTNTLLRNGYNAGLWDGANLPTTPAIVAPFAQTTPQDDGLGFASAGSANITSFGGASVGDDDVLVGLTLAGDANLDRIVNFNDLVALARDYNLSGKTWSNGNFDYDALDNVGFSDLVILARNYNVTLPGAVLSSSTPSRTPKSERFADSILI